MDDYYPYGLSFNSYQRPAETPNKWKFQGQELQDDLGLNWYTFKWRNHQPDIGRFFNIDPLAEDYYYNSPYAFSENDVISAVELEGLEKARITNWKVQKGIMQKTGTYTLNQAGNWEGTRYINQYVAYDNDGNWQKAYSSMEVGGSELMMAEDGVKVDKVIVPDVNYGELFSNFSNSYRGRMAKQTAKNVGQAGLSIIPGSTLLGASGKVPKAFAAADIAIKMDDISAMVNDGDMTVLEKAIGKDATNMVKALINAINTVTGASSTISNPSIGTVVGTIDSGASTVKNVKDVNKEDEKDK